MLVTLVALMCNGPVCLDKVVTNSDQSGISFMECQIHGQMVIADILKSGLYQGWTVQSYRCVLGPYKPRGNA